MPRIRYQLLIAFGIFCIITGIAVKNQLNKQEAFRQEMITVVKSQEGHDLLVKEFKKMDKDAFTEKGIIQSFEIDYTDVEHNPMGGIMFTAYINGDKTLYYTVNLSKDYPSEEYSYSSTYARELYDLIHAKKLGQPIHS